MARTDGTAKVKTRAGAAKKPAPAAAKPGKTAKRAAPAAAAKPAQPAPRQAPEGRLSVAAALLRKSARRIGL
jgi:hypothetical protein